MNLRWDDGDVPAFSELFSLEMVASKYIWGRVEGRSARPKYVIVCWAEVVFMRSESLHL